MARSAHIPRLLYSYLATEMLAPFFASFVVMNCVFFLVKLIPFLNVVLEMEISFADFIRLFCYLFPNMFLYSIPMAAMMGVIISFTRLASDTEILAFKASGISLYQMLPPVILVSLCIALLTSFFSISLIPKSEVAMKQLMFQVAKEKIDKGIKEDQFTEALGDLVVYVDAIDKESSEWENVWVSDMRGQVHPIITMAQSGNMTAFIDKMMVTITLHNGSLHRPDGNRSQIIGFETYTINIPLQTPTILDGDDVTHLSAKSMTLAQLQESATALGRDTDQGRNRLIHFHKRLVLPVGCFILSLLGLPLGLLAGPGKKAIGIPLGLGFFILYYILFTLGKTLADDTQLPVVFAMWLPNAVFLILMIYAIRQAARERPAIPDPIKNYISVAIDKLVSPVTKQFWNLINIFKPDTPKPPKPVPEPAPETSLPPKKVVTDQESSTYLTEGTVHGNVNSHIFHVQGCEHYYCKNCTIEFKDVALAIKSGFEPCRFCKTLLPK
jgi:lipopolysaccharide export system permease protein